MNPDPFLASCRAPTNIRVYHYPVRSYEQFERKIVQGHRAIAQSIRLGNRKLALARIYYQAWENGQLPQVYEELASRKSHLPG